MKNLFVWCEMKNLRRQLQHGNESIVMDLDNSLPGFDSVCVLMGSEWLVSMRVQGSDCHLAASRVNPVTFMEQLAGTHALCSTLHSSVVQAAQDENGKILPLLQSLSNPGHLLSSHPMMKRQHLLNEPLSSWYGN